MCLCGDKHGYTLILQLELHWVCWCQSNASPGRVRWPVTYVSLMNSSSSGCIVPYPVLCLNQRKEKLQDNDMMHSITSLPVTEIAKQWETSLLTPLFPEILLFFCFFACKGGGGNASLSSPRMSSSTLNKTSFIFSTSSKT